MCKNATVKIAGTSKNVEDTAALWQHSNLDEELLTLRSSLYLENVQFLYTGPQTIFSIFNNFSSFIQCLPQENSPLEEMITARELSPASCSIKRLTDEGMNLQLLFIIRRVTFK